MLDAVIATDSAGEVLIERYFAPTISRKEIEPVLKFIQSQKQIPPFFSSFGTVYVLNAFNNVIMIGLTQNEENTLMATSLINKITEMLDSTLQPSLTTETLKVDYSIAYGIIDQFIDSGFPFLDELNLIQSSKTNVLGDKLNVDIRSPWRAAFHQPLKQQDIKIIVKEHIFSRINSQGKSELLLVKGDINMSNKLNEPANMSLTFTIPGKLDDFSFHRCVDPSLYLSKTIQFIPPEGDFTLMSYTTQPKITALPIYIIPKFTWTKTSVLFEISLRIDQQYTKAMHNAQIKFSLPQEVSQPSLACASGDVKFHKDDNTIIWNIEPSADKQLLSMAGSASIPDGFNNEASNITIYTNFSISGLSISGVKVESPELMNPMKCTKVIEYLTLSGQYIFNVA